MVDYRDCACFALVLSDGDLGGCRPAGRVGVSGGRDFGGEVEGGLQIGQELDVVVEARAWFDNARFQSMEWEWSAVACGVGQACRDIHHGVRIVGESRHV
ncbi:hypothetical protein GCM10022222_50990 [Amycolatopsis ultiminotia]|uniref:Uncharacterized protein n=1 Tax=Amycolatopsis ultiminotia TaxID=543629 RepID=A0ABP6X7X6_9PSEU